MKAQKDLNAKEPFEKGAEDEPVLFSRREAAKLSLAAVLVFVPVCLAVLLLLCFICLPFLFF